MTDEEWNQEHARTLGVFLSGSSLGEMDDRGQAVSDVDFLLLLNAHHEVVPFSLPTVASGMLWVSLIDTSVAGARSPGVTYEASTNYSLQPRSLALLVERQHDQVRQDRRHEA